MSIRYSHMQQAGKIIALDYDPDRVLGADHKIIALSLFLDEDGYSCLSVTEEARNILYYPDSIKFFRDLVWRSLLPPNTVGVVSTEQICNLATELHPLIQIVAQGHSVAPRSDGILVGQLTPAAVAASQQIQRVMLAASWLTHPSIEQLAQARRLRA